MKARFEVNENLIYFQVVLLSPELYRHLKPIMQQQDPLT